VEERWITEKEISKFLDTLSQFAKNNDKKIQIFLFGGSALVLHGLREKTSDFDSIMLVNGEIDKKFFNDAKPLCLNSIGLYKDNELYENTFNDISVLPETAHVRAMEYHRNNYERYQFEFKELDNLIVNIPSKKFLLSSRLVDLITNNPKTNLDKIDAQVLIKKLGINNENKKEFLDSISHNKKHEITIVLDQVLKTMEYASKASINIEEIKKSLSNNDLKISLNHKK